jgi:hypothetical protein
MAKRKAKIEPTMTSMHRDMSAGSMNLRGKHAKAMMGSMKPGKKIRMMVDGTIDSMSMDKYGDNEPEHRVSMRLHNASPYSGGTSKSKSLRKGI